MNLYFQNSPSRHPSMSADEAKGSLHLTMVYDPIAGILTIRLIEVMVSSNFNLKKSSTSIFPFQAQDLQPRDFSGTADPYAKIRLLPDHTKTNMWQTRIHKRTLNPGDYFLLLVPWQFSLTVSLLQYLMKILCLRYVLLQLDVTH